MTDAQRKLVEDNHNLIYMYIHKYLDNNIDEWYGILAIALCKAATHYDSTKGIKFSSYASRCFSNEVKMTYRKDYKSRAIPTGLCVSLDDTVYEGKDNSKLLLKDMIPSTNNVESEVLFKASVDSLSEKEKRIVNLYIEGYNQKEIASIIGNSQSYISRLMKGIQEKLSIEKGI